MFDFREFVQNLRARRGESQKEFGRKVGISRATVSLIEVGEQEPNFETCYAMERLAGLPRQHLVIRAAFNDMERSGIDFVTHLRDPELLRQYRIQSLSLEGGDLSSDEIKAALLVREGRMADLIKWAADRLTEGVGPPGGNRGHLGHPSPAVAADSKHGR